MSVTNTQPDGDSGGRSSHAAEMPDPKSPDVHQSAEVLQRISDYQLIRKIGRGGMGEVYEALHARLKRRVAVKLLPEGRISEPGTLRRFFREMEAAGKLTHPHIVQATDAGEVNGVPYLVMELVDGADLGHLVRQFGSLPPLAALEAIEQASLGLEHIHHHGLVHRDVKPSNLLMDRQAVVKVGDLGLAQLNHPPSQSDDLTSSDLLLGTVDYMAPEQAETPKLVDHRADIYGLGCCLYYLLTGQTVFDSGGRIDRLLAHRTQLPPALAQRCQTAIPQSLERLFRRMLEKRPAQRPGSMRDVRAELTECRQELQRRFAASDTGDVPAGSHRFPPTAGIREVANIVFSDSGRRSEPFVSTTVVCQPERRPERSRTYRRASVGLAVLFVAGAISLYSWSQPGDSNLPASVDEATPETGGERGAIISEVSEIPSAHAGAVYALEFSPDGELLFSAGDDGVVRAWELPSGKVRGEIRDLDGEIVIDVGVLPDSPHIVAGSYSGRAYVWNWMEGRIERTFDKAIGHVESVAVAGSSRVVTSGVDDVLYLWETTSGTVLAELPNEHEGGVRALAVDPSGKSLVAGDYEGNLTLWDLDQSARIASPAIVPEPITIWTLDWAADGSTIAIGGAIRSGEVGAAKALLVVYDPLRREVVRKLVGHRERVNAVRFSRDGRVLYSAAEDLRAWSLPDGNLLHHESLSSSELFGLAESIDGAVVAVGSAGGTIYLVPTSDLPGRRPSQSLH